jgi:pimeloyl-ACP methyl ester carboxylesterase
MFQVFSRRYNEEGFLMAQNISAQRQKIGVPVTSIRRVEADGIQVFYREAGDPQAPVVLLLHGFPTSSFMYRELIPRLADRYRVIAPDLPGFGFTEVPEKRNYAYTFDALAATVDAFTKAIRLDRYAIYVFVLRSAYGVPPGDGSSGTNYGDHFAEWQCL